MQSGASRQDARQTPVSRTGLLSALCGSAGSSGFSVLVGAGVSGEVTGHRPSLALLTSSAHPTQHAYSRLYGPSWKLLGCSVNRAR